MRCARTIDAMANRLAGETSPYLLQHAHNPVDWYPWGPEALARARELDRPIFLSIGYAACHWCHVMERESFEDEATAAQLNDGFIAIKVDREERPDLDALYMGAVQAITGQGGWPMSVFLTPAGVPFFGGTYYPDTPRHGMPSFRQVLDGVAARVEGQVDVGVDEAGQQRRPGEVDELRVRRRRDPTCLDGEDPPVLDQHEGVGVGGPAVEERGGADRRAPQGGGAHGLLLPSEVCRVAVTASDRSSPVTWKGSVGPS